MKVEILYRESFSFHAVEVTQYEIYFQNIDKCQIGTCGKILYILKKTKCLGAVLSSFQNEEMNRYFIFGTFLLLFASKYDTCAYD